MTVNPCYKCDYRYVACHSTCEQYQEWLAIHEEETAAIRRNRNAENDAIGFLVTHGERDRRNYQRLYAQEKRRQNDGKGN